MINDDSCRITHARYIRKSAKYNAVIAFIRVVQISKLDQ